jgi:hypothetical protein
VSRRSIYKGQGWLLNDNRCSGGTCEEADMLGCSHCQKLMKIQDWKCDGGFCHSCDAPTCGPCATLTQTKGCQVFLRSLEGALEKQYRLQQNAMLLGLDLDDRNKSTAAAGD